VLALIGWATVGVLRAILAVGHYEERINVVTHGNVDVLPAWLVYMHLDALMPRGWETTVVDMLWALGSLVAVVAVAAWLYRSARHAVRLGGVLAWSRGWAVGGWFVPVANLVIPYLVVRDVRRGSGPAPRPAPVGWWWVSVLATVLLSGLTRLYHLLVSAGGTLHGTALDTRTVAYPLWTVAAAIAVAAAFLSVRVVSRITEAQQRTALAGATRPA
jgi:hypothetical protein